MSFCPTVNNKAYQMIKMYTNILACIHASAPEIKSTEAFIYTNNTYENHVHKTKENMQF